MTASNIIRKLSSLLCAALLLAPAVVFADYDLNMTKSVTKLGNDIYDLHMIVLWIVTVVGIGVFGVMIYSIINHRKSKGHQAAQFHESTTVEVIWTVIPLVVLVVIAIPATKTLLQIEDASNPDVNIKITGWQWKWEYDYIDDGVHFFSNLDETSNKARQLKSGTDVKTVDHYLLNVDKPITVPVNKKVRLLITAEDVIHAWWVPDLAVKRDAIPGYINESWFIAEKEGVYRGQCAELCGKDHGFMPIVVNVVSQDKYKQWIADQQKAAKLGDPDDNKVFTLEESMKRGEGIYNKACAACHMPNGKGIPGTFPAIENSPIATGDVNAHIDIVLHGKPGTAMQAFGSQLSKADLAAVITYERNAFGNKTGDLVQPSQISR